MSSPISYARALARYHLRHRILGRPTKRRILHEMKCIFVHVPKTGGNSVTTALNAISPTAPGRLYPTLSKHSKAHEVRAAVGDEIWDRYFSFAIVRNPWDLMVSSYHWWLQKARKWRKFDVDVRRIEAMDGFSEYIQSEYGTTMINRRPGAVYDWISADGEVIVDHVGKLENMPQEWAHICQCLGIDVALPYLNRTERRDYRDYYTDETRQLVAERFARTIEAFEYEF